MSHFHGMKLGDGPSRLRVALIIASCLSALVCSCNGPGQKGRPTATRIELSMKLAEAQAILLEAGARDISLMVSAVVATSKPGVVECKLLWYELPDKTVISLFSSRRTGKEEFILRGICLGPKGAGLPGKLERASKMRSVGAVDVRTLESVSIRPCGTPASSRTDTRQ